MKGLAAGLGIVVVSRTQAEDQRWCLQKGSSATIEGGHIRVSKEKWEGLGDWLQKGEGTKDYNRCGR